jgi:hypothetical protein
MNFPIATSQTVQGVIASSSWRMGYYPFEIYTSQNHERSRHYMAYPTGVVLVQAVPADETRNVLNLAL